jgi:hypothetical protein
LYTADDDLAGRLLLLYAAADSLREGRTRPRAENEVLDVRRDALQAAASAETAEDSRICASGGNGDLLAS